MGLVSTPPRPSAGSPGARLVLLLSPERSGSTLLSTMLGAHRQIVAPPELHLFGFPSFDAWRIGYPPAIRSLVAAYDALGAPLGEAGLRTRFAGRPVEEVYEDLLARCGSGRFFLDKTPAYARRAGALERAEGFRPFFVWLVRHPLGVASSRIERVDDMRRQERGLKARLKYPLYVLRRELRRRSGRELRGELSRWADAHERIERFLAGIAPERWHRLHYEGLVRAPEKEIERLCQRLGLEMEPAMLDPRSHLPKGLSWGVGDEKVRRHARIDPSLADRWREHYDEAHLDPRSLSLMRRLGV